MTKILVTGATGTVGSHVAKQLVEMGVETRALTRDPAKPYTVGDLTEPHSMRTALDGVDAVFLVWPFAGADGVSALLKVVAEHARRVVYLSSAAVREHERQVEQEIDRSGLEWTFLRPHVFAANALRWAEEIREEGTVHGPYGKAATAPIHERDLAAVAVRALTGDGHTGAAYELTGPELLSQSDQVRVIGEEIGRPVRWIETSPEAERRRMLGLGWPGEVVDGILQAQADLVTRPGPLTSTVETVTGRRARTFHTWASDHAGAFLHLPAR
ncbi:NAD(P)H-binding protein [Nonomuraea sp. NBC_01738]|uniref:NAD(P)H-binding protein n=1 Tax=Nonomuraea sp. NBC_01738 TaxID=2976003 RepID=UPI002E0F7A31|nr:NAD(P)H-binding protein [Nonomuraea sp. NBC_01738]